MKSASGKRPPDEAHGPGKEPIRLLHLGTSAPWDSNLKTKKNASGKRPPDEAHGPGDETIRPQRSSEAERSSEKKVHHARRSDNASRGCTESTFAPLESNRKTMKSASGKRPPDEAHGPGKEPIRLLHLGTSAPWDSNLKTKKNASGKRPPDEAHGPGDETIRPQRSSEAERSSEKKVHHARRSDNASRGCTESTFAPLESNRKTMKSASGKRPPDKTHSAPEKKLSSRISCA